MKDAILLALLGASIMIFLVGVLWIIVDFVNVERRKHRRKIERVVLLPPDDERTTSIETYSINPEFVRWLRSGQDGT